MHRAHRRSFDRPGGAAGSLRVSAAVLLAFWIALSGAAPSEASDAAETPPPADAAAEWIAESAHFAFYSDPEVSLHHLLYRWARTEPIEGARTRDRGRPLPLREEDRAGLAGLSPEEQARWRAAVETYREHVAGRSLLFDDGLVAVRDVLAGKRGAESLGEVDRKIVALVEGLLPLYRRAWWSRHDAESRAWVHSALADIRKYEERITRTITRALAATWPPPPIRVDMAPYASGTPAYTTNEPHSVIQGNDPGIQMPWAVELVFHEASHSDAISQPLLGLVDEAFAAAGERPARNFWHIVLFATAGEATRMAFADDERDYTPYAQEQSVFYGSEPGRLAWDAVLAHWVPGVRGEVEPKVAMAKAAAAFVEALEGSGSP